MKRMTLSEYLAVPENYRGVWTTERWDIPDWENLRKSGAPDKPCGVGRADANPKLLLNDT